MIQPLCSRPETERLITEKLLAQIAPATIRTLSIPLTPARAAALDLFEIRTGQKIESVILDILDDTVFALLSFMDAACQPNLGRETRTLPNPLGAAES